MRALITQTCPALSGSVARATEQARVVAPLRFDQLCSFSSAIQMSELPSDRSVNSTLSILCDKIQAELVLSVQSEADQTPILVHPLLNMINCVGAPSLPGPPELGIEWRFDLFEELDNARSSGCEVFLPDLDLATNPFHLAAIDEPATTPPRTGLIIEMENRCLGTLYDPVAITVRQVVNMALAYWSDNLECVTAEEADALREAHSIPADFPLRRYDSLRYDEAFRGWNDVVELDYWNGCAYLTTKPFRLSPGCG